MDTWSTLLLLHDLTKTDASQQIRDPTTGSVPPCRLGIGGIIAERHVENIRTMKTIGAAQYIKACGQLNPEETLLRQKVYNFYTGPGIVLHPISNQRLLLLAHK